MSGGSQVVTGQGSPSSVATPSVLSNCGVQWKKHGFYSRASAQILSLVLAGSWALEMWLTQLKNWFVVCLNSAHVNLSSPMWLVATAPASTGLDAMSLLTEFALICGAPSCPATCLVLQVHWNLLSAPYFVAGGVFPHFTFAVSSPYPNVGVIFISIKFHNLEFSL